MQSCLARIRAEDESIHAWVQVLPRKATGNGTLSGIPFGAKDIMETRGLATEYGSPVYKGRTGTTDAAVVRDLRNRGAILLGKTHTAAFAYQDPPPTRNPRNPEHTPGGSSSGSAAAVAAGMTPLALGTQTGGSVLRPASYCGVTGFKPSYGLLSLDGVLQLAKSLDTLGFFTHTPADMLLLWKALGHPIGKAGEVSLGVPDSLPGIDPEMQAAFQKALDSFSRAGMKLKKLDISPMLTELQEANRLIMVYEGARFHRQRFEEFGDRLGAVATMVREGLQIPVSRYDETMQFVSRSKQRMVEVFKDTTAILTPAAPGAAPKGIASTGNANQNRPWTTLGTAAISIPMPVNGNLPLGLQIASAPGQDAPLLHTAVRLNRILHAE